MRILQISTGLDISISAGGIPNYVRNLSETLSDLGHEIYVLYSRDNGNEKKYNYNIINCKPKLQPFHLSSVIENEDIDDLEEVVKEISPDIIHVHMMIDLPIKIIEMFKRNARVIISLHDYSHICNRIQLIYSDKQLCKNNNENLKCNTCISYEETIDNRILRGIIRRGKDALNVKKIANSFGHHERFLIGKELFQQVDALSAVSSRVKEIYIENGYTNKNFYVNHIGNYTAEDSFRKNFDHKSKKSNGEKLKFGFIGSLGFNKGSDIFLKLAEYVHHEFHIYGGIDKDVHKTINNFENVYYHGRYNHSDLVDILKNIDIGLVLPIWEDNAPQVVFEFLNAGIPVLGTRMGGIPDFINDSNGYLFTPNIDEINNLVNFMNSDNIYDFYNQTINFIKGTKKPIDHAHEIIDIYKSL